MPKKWHEFLADTLETRVDQLKLDQMSMEKRVIFWAPGPIYVNRHLTSEGVVPKKWHEFWANNFETRPDKPIHITLLLWFF